MQFSNTCVHLRLCDCTMQWLCQPTNDLLITRVLSSSVVRASDCCLEGCGCNSHLELRIFCVLLSTHVIQVTGCAFPFRFPMMNVGMNPFLGQQVSYISSLSSALCVVYF